MYNLILLTYLCSKFCGYYLRQSNINLQRTAFPKINVNTLETFPIPEISIEQKILINEQVDSLLKLYSDLNLLTNNFIQLLNNSLSTNIKSRKIQDWPGLTSKDFIAELTKQKVKLSLSQQSEWMTFLTEQQAKAHTIQTVLDQTEREINKLVYQLYGLTNEEITIIEGR